MNLNPPPAVVGCDGKKSMPSLAEAQRAASLVRRRRNEHVTAYRCIKCHQYHVGGTDERGEVQRQKTYKRQRARLKEGDE